MPTTDQLQFDIQQGIQSLPGDALQEVKLFIEFLRMREAAARQSCSTDIDLELRQLDMSEARHLEQEFAAYQEIYPRED
ncbi:hypothetical protein [Desulfonatronum parangueonense]